MILQQNLNTDVNKDALILVIAIRLVIDPT